jgi:hypothetical protein
LIYNEFHDVKNQVREGDKLKLIREPDNAYDAHAIAVYAYGRKLGYIPTEDNLLLSNMIDKNIAIFEAEISYISESDYYWDKLELCIYSCPLH